MQLCSFFEGKDKGVLMMMPTVTLPHYTFEAIKNYDQGNKEQLLFAVLGYLFEGTEPNLQGWDACMFAMMVDDLQTRQELIARGGQSVARLLNQ